jgi:hypothetical protein
MHDDDILPALRRILQHPDTGFIPLPAGLSGTNAADAWGVSERTLRRDCREHGIGILDGKTYLVVIPAAEAFYGNDTGPLHNYQHDIKLISQLTGWRVSLSTPEGAQIIPIAWHTTDQEVSPMDAGLAPMKFDRTLRLKIPEAMESALQFVARRKLQSISSLARQALLSELQREGFIITDTGLRRAEEV